MSNIYKGEFQDYEGNVVYPHTSADVVFATDGQTIQKKLNDAEIDYTDVKAQLTSGEHEFRFGITADGEFGYHKEVEGADTVIPFSSGKIMDVDYSITTSPTIIEIDLTSKKSLILVDHYSEWLFFSYYCDLTDNSIWGKEITWDMYYNSGKSSTGLYFTLDASKKQLSIRTYSSSLNNQHHIKKVIAV